MQKLSDPRDSSNILMGSKLEGLKSSYTPQFQSQATPSSGKEKSQEEIYEWEIYCGTPTVPKRLNCRSGTDVNF